MPGEGEGLKPPQSRKSFIKKRASKYEMAKGNPISYLEEKWKILLKIIHVYITCEGRYGRTMFYLFILLLHFTGKQPLNMPFYLLKSLTKMASKVQAKHQKANNNLFHHGLIKIIVLEELNRRNKT
jgi:hypothetical protein